MSRITYRSRSDLRARHGPRVCVKAEGVTRKLYKENMTAGQCSLQGAGRERPPANSSLAVGGGGGSISPGSGPQRDKTAPTAGSLVGEVTQEPGRPAGQPSK